jgi:sulfonate transport system substrate-binding protein
MQPPPDNTGDVPMIDVADSQLAHRSRLALTRRGLLGTAGAAIGLASSSAHASSIWPANVPAGITLVAGDQNEELQTRLVASGEHAKLASKVTYANFLGGPAILEAFRAGALDLATVGNTPLIQAQAAGERIPIIAAIRTADVDYHFAARPGIVLNRLEDLRGKKITYGEGTGRQPYVLNALKQAGRRTAQSSKDGRPCRFRGALDHRRALVRGAA